MGVILLYFVCPSVVIATSQVDVMKFCVVRTCWIRSATHIKFKMLDGTKANIGKGGVMREDGRTDVGGWCGRSKLLLQMTK